MPTYEYDCQSCGYEMEAFQSMTEEHLKKCPECGKDSLKRRIGMGAGIIFKGSGFYETDYKDKKSDKTSDNSAKGDVKSDINDKSESKSDGKSEAKKETKPAIEGKKKTEKSGGGNEKK